MKKLWRRVRRREPMVVDWEQHLPELRPTVPFDWAEELPRLRPPAWRGGIRVMEPV